MRNPRLLAALVAGVLLVAGAPAVGAQPPADPDFKKGSVFVDVTDTTITMGTPSVERTWARTGFGTTRLARRESGSFSAWGSTPARPDFRLYLGADIGEVESTDFDVESFTVTETQRGLRLEMVLGVPDVFSITRTIEAYNGISGFRTETSIVSAAPLALKGYTIDELSVAGAAPTIHALRAGADWREPGWGGPQLAIGDPHAGTWRDTRTAGPGEPLDVFGEWISLEESNGWTSFMVMERNDFPSSRARYDGVAAALVVDHSYDIVSAGPFEESIHAENPQPGIAGRVRTVRPFEPFELEAAFTGFAKDVDDEAWQFHKYLTREVLEPYDHDITFNSNGTDGNVISTGAKDDMNYATVLQTAPIAKALGIETFILDDGWQAKSGEWFPDCPGHEEPRNSADPVKFAPRFPDCDFSAVRDAIYPMKLGLWMNPMHYHPTASTWQEHPDWVCQPVGSALHGYNTIDQTGGSNEAGLAQWGPNAIPYIESKIRTMIEDWDVKYFKFDFLVWLDCVGQGDLYEFKEAFGDMLDRLIADYHDVTFSVDETNDYRFFPFESVTRGPSWFQNGSPPPHQLLHNIHNLSPFIPSYYIGQHFLGGNQWREHEQNDVPHDPYPVDTLMAIALTSHMTFFSDLRNLPAWVIDEAKPWTDFYKTHRDAFGQLIYPLLADPMERDWTALQSWNPEDGFGALLAFRQNSPEATKVIPLVNVPENMTFDLVAAPTGEFIRTVTSEELTNGLSVTLDAEDTAVVYVISPSTPDGLE